MILRDIFVGLDWVHYSTDVAYAFKLRSRCLCHFIGRQIWKKRIRVSGFNRIVVELAKSAAPKFYVNAFQVACIGMPLEHTDFQDLQGDALQEFYIDSLESGVDQFLSDHAEVLAAIHEAIGLFRAAGYKNEWIEKSRRFRDLGLSASLYCRMTIDRFALRLVILRSKKLVYDQEIFTSDPDEIAFVHRFKDVVVADGKVVVTSRISKPLLMLSLKDIEANGEPTQITTDNSGASTLRV